MASRFFKAGYDFGKEVFKKKKTLTLGKNQTDLKKLEFKIKKAPSKARIEISGHGKMGEMVEPKKDLIEDYEILRDKISRGKK